MGRKSRFGGCLLAALLSAGAARAGAESDASESAPYRDALLIDLSTAFVPVANDVPMMLSGGLRFAHIHEVWARGGYMLTGDDAGLGFGALGYRAALRPGKQWRPIFGGLVATLPEQCTHDALRNPTCERVPLFVIAATAGIRFEPIPKIGFYTQVALGMDSYPNPFGMLEAGVTFILPFAEWR